MLFLGVSIREGATLILEQIKTALLFQTICDVFAIISPSSDVWPKRNTYFNQ